MLLWKKIWIALLLVIAGSGQLPLWLHDSLCHHQHDATGCCEHDEACGSDGRDIADSTTSLADCPWGHSDTNADGKAQQRLNWSAESGSEDHTCAACYFLSQSISISPNQSIEPPALLVAEVGSKSLPWIAEDLLAVYASRAPPAL